MIDIYGNIFYEQRSIVAKYEFLEVPSTKFSR